MRMIKSRSVGAELDHLEAERNIVTDPDDNRYRRTLQLVKKNDSWGFTLATYGIKHKKRKEIDVVTYVDYIELNGPADVAGMRKGDVIVSVNGQSVENFSHQEIVTCIKTSSDNLRLVVLFEDCCRKVELQYRILQLKKLLSAKVKELRDVESEEQILINDICYKRGLSRYDVLRQSIISSISGASWDQYSILTPNQVSRISRDQEAHKRFVRQSLSENREGGSVLSYSLDDSYPDLSYIDTGSSLGACSMEDLQSDHDSTEIDSEKEFGLNLAEGNGNVTSVNANLDSCDLKSYVSRTQRDNRKSFPSKSKKEQMDKGAREKRMVRETKNFESNRKEGKDRKTSSSSLPDISFSKGFRKVNAGRQMAGIEGRFSSKKKISSVSEPALHISRINVNERFPLKSLGTQIGLRVFRSSDELSSTSNEHKECIHKTVISLKRPMSEDYTHIFDRSDSFDNDGENKHNPLSGKIELRDVSETDNKMSLTNHPLKSCVSKCSSLPQLPIPQIIVTQTSGEDMMPMGLEETYCKATEQDNNEVIAYDIGYNNNVVMNDTQDSQNDIVFCCDNINSKHCISCNAHNSQLNAAKCDTKIDLNDKNQNIHDFKDECDVTIKSCQNLTNDDVFKCMPHSFCVINFYSESEVYINEKDEETKL